MSGSGSATFALASSKASGENLMERLKNRFGSTLWTALVKAVPE